VAVGSEGGAHRSASMEDEGVRRGPVPPRTEGTDTYYRRGGLPMRAHDYQGGHGAPGLGLRARDRRVAADGPLDNGALGVHRVRVRHMVGKDVPQARRSVQGSLARSTTVRRCTAARRGARGARVRGRGSTLRSGVCFFTVYPASTAIFSKNLN
jgi:hypothetical protein